MRRLVLVGGGHAHLEVLRSIALRPLRSVEVLLLSPEPTQPYSSMLPGFLRHDFEESALTFDLPAIARSAGASYRQSAALHVDVPGRSIETGDGELEFDLASLDVGSAPAGLETPGAAAHSFPIRPWSSVLALRKKLDSLAGASRPYNVTIVGAGAGGTEVALAVARRSSGTVDRSKGVVRLIERDPVILGEFPVRARRLAVAALESAGVQVMTEATIACVEADRLVLDDGSSVPSDITVWLGGSAPPPLIRHSVLPGDAEGYFSVDATLRAVDGTPLFGAGDCVSLQHHPDLPKAGVYAVRQAPVLAHNIRATLEGGEPRRYQPQERFLALLDTADGAALLRYGPLAWHGRPAAWLKRVIDRRFVRRYRKLYRG